MQSKRKLSLLNFAKLALRLPRYYYESMNFPYVVPLVVKSFRAAPCLYIIMICAENAPLVCCNRASCNAELDLLTTSAPVYPPAGLLARMHVHTRSMCALCTTERESGGTCAAPRARYTLCIRPYIVHKEREVM